MGENKEKLKRLRGLVRESFAKRMQKYGFDRHSDGTFYQKTDFGRLGITLFYHHYGDALKIEASASIKVDEAEKLLFEYRSTVQKTPFASPKKPKEFTVCENLGNIKIGIWRQWFIYSESDVESTIDEIETLVENVGIPFLKRFREPRFLLQEMADSTKGKSVLGRPVFQFDELFALTLALNRRDIFNEMRPVFEDMLRNHKQYSFSRVREYLDWIEAKFGERNDKSQENTPHSTS